MELKNLLNVPLNKQRLTDAFTKIYVIVTIRIQNFAYMPVFFSDILIKIQKQKSPNAPFELVWTSLNLRFDECSEMHIIFQFCLSFSNVEERKNTH